MVIARGEGDLEQKVDAKAAGRLMLLNTGVYKHFLLLFLQDFFQHTAGFEVHNRYCWAESIPCGEFGNYELYIPESEEKESMIERINQEIENALEILFRDIKKKPLRQFFRIIVLPEERRADALINSGGWYYANPLYPDDEKFATIFVYDSRLKRGVISHEMTHLVLDLLTINRETEEKAPILPVLGEGLASYVQTKVNNLNYYLGSYIEEIRRTMGDRVYEGGAAESLASPSTFFFR